MCAGGGYSVRSGIDRLLPKGDQEELYGELPCVPQSNENETNALSS